VLSSDPEEKENRESPPELAVREPFAVKFKIQSTWGSTLPLHIELERSELYAFSGHKDLSIRLLPCDAFEIQPIFMALATGRIAFPKINIKCSSNSLGAESENRVQCAEEEGACNQLIRDHSFKELPSTIYVLT